MSVEDVLNIAGFDLQRTLEMNPRLLDPWEGPTIAHDASITSVSIDQSAPRHLRKVGKGELDFATVQEWVGDLLEEEGEHIYRMKGVLAIAHAPRRFVIHGVHMLIEGSYGEEWADG